MPLLVNKQTDSKIKKRIFIEVILLAMEKGIVWTEKSIVYFFEKCTKSNQITLLQKKVTKDLRDYIQYLSIMKKPLKSAIQSYVLCHNTTDRLNITYQQTLHHISFLTNCI